MSVRERLLRLAGPPRPHRRCVGPSLLIELTYTNAESSLVGVKHPSWYFSTCIKRICMQHLDDFNKSCSSFTSLVVSQEDCELSPASALRFLKSRASVTSARKAALI